MAGARVELPDGHLVNLSPRPTKHSPYRAYRADYKASPTELSATPPPRYAQDARSNGYANSRGASDNMAQKLKATKLPLPRSFADSQNNEMRQTPSPTGLPKPTTPSHSGQRDQPRSSDKDRDQYWRKVRDKFEKDSPLSQRSARSKESDNEQSPNARMSYHRTRPPAGTRQNQTSSRGGTATARSGIPSPSTVNSSPAQGVKSNASASHPVDSKNKWRKQGDQWINMDVPDNTPHKSERTDTTSDSSPRSHPSISPVSAEDSSITDWEDRFVVNMPTAKDPNPPTMTAQQIAEYQKSIERVHQTGGRMVDPDSLPSRNNSPESKSSLRGHQEQNPKEFRAYDGTYEGKEMPSASRDEFRQPSPPQQPQYQQQPDPQVQAQTQAQPTAAAQQRQTATHYYSPDEIGHNRISTIWEESPTKTKGKRHPQNADGSFLGCREISGEKNPDEILMFASPDDASLHPRPLALTSKNKHKELKEVKKGTARQTTHKVEETIVLQEERPQTSRNSRPAQCSKSSTICQDQNCPPNQTTIPRTGSQDSGKENFHPPSSTPERSGSIEEGRGDDDVFIITPTITRTMIPTPDKKPSAPKPQGLRRPGGSSHTVTAEAIKAVRAKAQMISTPSGLRPGGSNSKVKPTGSTMTTSQTFPASTLTGSGNDQGPVDRGQDRTQERTPERAAGTASNTIRGFIRTSGLARSSGMVRSPTDSLATILRNGTESLRNRAESLRNGSGSHRANWKESSSAQSTIPSRDNSDSSRSERSFQSFQSARETPAFPGNIPASPPKPATAQNEPTEKKSSPRKSTTPSTPTAKRVSLSEEAPSTEKPDKPPKSSKKISALAKPTKVDKMPKPAKPQASETSPPPKAKKAETLPKQEDPPKKEERIKPQPRLRTSGKIMEIAELDGLQVASPKEYLQSNITDVHADLGDMRSQDKTNSEGNIINPLALSLVFNILVVAVTQVNRALRMGTDSYYTKFVVRNTLSMTSHCYRVFSCIYAAVSRYQATGAWPKARNDQAISRFMVELLQAVVYLFILGFAAMLIGRTAGYVVLVSSWIVWFARPFAWAFQCIGRALIM